MVHICMQVFHTCACAFNIIIKNLFIVCSSRHTQQAGLWCHCISHNQETLQGNTQLTHLGIWKVKGACQTGRPFLICSYTACHHDNRAVWSKRWQLGGSKKKRGFRKLRQTFNDNTGWTIILTYRNRKFLRNGAVSLPAHETSTKKNPGPLNVSIFCWAINVPFFHKYSE